MTGRHLLDILANATGETPFFLVCAAFGITGLALVTWGIWLDVRDQKRAEENGEC